MLIGRVAQQEDQLWSADIEEIGAFTQGASREEAVAELAIFVEQMVRRSGFKATATELGGTEDGATAVYVTANEPVMLAALVLKYQREIHKLSQQQAAERSGGRYQSDYAVYERGEREPSLSKYIELLGAVAPELALTVGPLRLERAK